MYAFQYHKASSLDDAATAFAGSSDARYLAGGQTLLASLKLRLAQPDRLVDLRGIEGLRGIFTKDNGRMLVVGAMTTHAEVAESATVRETLPALAALASEIGDPMVRHMGTLGGSIANNDPAADYPAALIALGAEVCTSSHRRIGADEFFTGMFSTALEAGELVTSVEFPAPRRAAYVKFRHPASRFALVGVFVADTANGPRVAVTGAAPCVFRSTAMEEALAREFSAQAIEGITIDQDELSSDMHATAAYRASLIVEVARRALLKATSAS